MFFKALNTSMQVRDKARPTLSLASNCSINDMICNYTIYPLSQENEDEFGSRQNTAGAIKISTSQLRDTQTTAFPSPPSTATATFHIATQLHQPYPPKMSSFLTRRAAIAAPRAVRAFSSTPVRPVAKITIVGNLADTPELHATSTGRELLKYAVASNTGSRDNRTTSWFRVTSFENEGPRRDYFQTLPKGYVCPLYIELLGSSSRSIGLALADTTFPAELWFTSKARSP